MVNSLISFRINRLIYVSTYSREGEVGEPVYLADADPPASTRKGKKEEQYVVPRSGSLPR